MVKRKAAAQADAHEQDTPEPEAAAEASVSRDPIEGEWRGTPRWRCPFCAFDSPEKARVERHIATAHPEPGLSIAQAREQKAAAQAAAPPPEPVDYGKHDSPADAPEKGEGA